MGGASSSVSRLVADHCRLSHPLAGVLGGGQHLVRELALRCPGSAADAPPTGCACRRSAAPSRSRPAGGACPPRARHAGCDPQPGHASARRSRRRSRGHAGESRRSPRRSRPRARCTTVSRVCRPSSSDTTSSTSWTNASTAPRSYPRTASGKSRLAIRSVALRRKRLVSNSVVSESAMSEVSPPERSPTRLASPSLPWRGSWAFPTSASCDAAQRCAAAKCCAASIAPTTGALALRPRVAAAATELESSDDPVAQRLAAALRASINATQSDAEKAWIGRIENLRERLARSDEQIEAVDYGTGSAETERTAEEMARGTPVVYTVSDLCLELEQPAAVGPRAVQHRPTARAGACRRDGDLPGTFRGLPGRRARARKVARASS